MDSKTMFVTMSPWRLFFTVALPGMVSMFAMSIYSIIEGVFIGQKLGEAAFAAINIAFPLVMINFSIADLVGVGSSVPISIALGRKEEETANNIFSCSVVMILIASVIMGTTMFFAAEPLARLMGADESLLHTASKYIRTFALCSPLTTIFFAMDNYLRISGYIKTSMFINIFFNASTIGLLVFFLIGLDMDVSGSALASSISMCLCSLLAMIPFVRGKALLKFRKPKISMKLLKEIAACGFPTFMSNIAGRVTSILMNISLMTLGIKVFGEGGGTTAVAAYAVLMYAGELCQPLIYGMSDSIAPAIGFNWGAENYDRVKNITKCGFIGAGAIGIVASGVMFFFAEPLASLFVDAEEVKLLELATHALRLFSVTYLVRWFAISAQSFLGAIEKPLQATILSVCVAFLFPVIMLGALWGLKLDGIWLNMFGTSVLALVLGIILIKCVWKRVKR
ncbi:MAG: MATE family efflux transporter [Clostridia bacterium]|nr:MATE family efflux transporter [Clostridia bacterium]